MKLCFSTLGCPGWSWEDIFATAKDLGLDGIEVRGIGKHIYVPHAKPFLPQNLAKTLGQLNDAHMVLPVLSSSAVLGVQGQMEQGVREAYEYIDLAQKCNAPYVRVMITEKAAPGSKVDVAACVENYRKVCEYGASKGVMPLIETNDVLADSVRMAEFLAEVNHPNMGVLWDVHHPYRFYHETPKLTYQNIGKYVRHIHVKDSIFTDNQVQYRMMGYGDVPIFDTLSLLKEHGYQGFISLEWLKRWNEELQEPGIVFSHYVSYMQFLLEQI